MDAQIDVQCKGKDEDGDIQVDFTMPGAGTVSRFFKTMESALTMATFTAAQVGVVKPEELIPWLVERGFPGRQPGEVPEGECAMKKIEIKEI